MDESLITRAEGVSAYRLPPCVQNLLRFLYPTIDWRLVGFFNDIPWWLDAVNYDSNAVTLPDGLSGAIFVFFNSRKLSPPSAMGAELTFPHDLNGLCRPGQSALLVATLVHECVHVLRFQQSKSLGYFSGGAFDYLQCWVCHGFAYDDTLPPEKEAYDQDRSFTTCVVALGLDMADWCMGCGPDGTGGPLATFTASACGQALVKSRLRPLYCCDNIGAAATFGAAVVAVGLGIIATVVKVVLVIITPIVEWVSNIFNSTEDDNVRADIGSTPAIQLAMRSDAELAEMVRRLFDGPTGDDDERALLRLLSVLPCPRVGTLVRSFGVQVFLDEFHGEEYGHLQLLLLNCGVLPIASLDDDGVRTLVSVVDCARINGLSVGVLHGLLRQLLTGSTGDEDEQTINKIMNCLDPAKIRSILRLRGTEWDDFDSAIQYDEWDDFLAIMAAKGIPEP